MIVGALIWLVGLTLAALIIRSLVRWLSFRLKVHRVNRRMKKDPLFRQYVYYYVEYRTLR